MAKAMVILSVLVAILIAKTSCQIYEIPVYRPPTTKVIIVRKVREAPSEPLWLNQGDRLRASATGDHPFLPEHDIKLHPGRRFARSLDSPGAKRDGSHFTSGSSKHTGQSHPGYNRRHIRAIWHPYDIQTRRQMPFEPFNSFPRLEPQPLHPIYARNIRETQEDEDFEYKLF